jgi:hypothetical protein
MRLAITILGLMVFSWSTFSSAAESKKRLICNIVDGIQVLDPVAFEVDGPWKKIALKNSNWISGSLISMGEDASSAQLFRIGISRAAQKGEAVGVLTGGVSLADANVIVSGYLSRIDLNFGEVKINCSLVLL